MTQRMPVLFVGLGSPLNLLEENDYTRALSELPDTFEKPRAIVCVSSAYMTEGIKVMGHEKPRLIRDFHEFPDELNSIEYPAKGDKELAKRIAELTGAEVDKAWGLDHGCWTVLYHLFPLADVPVVELSIDPGSPYADDFERGAKLAQLRDEGVLVVCTGGIVFNPKLLNWNEGAQPYDWALEFERAVLTAIKERDVASLLMYKQLPGADKAMPADDHYKPLLVALGCAGKDAHITCPYRGFENSSVSLTTLRLD